MRSHAMLKKENNPCEEDFVVITDYVFDMGKTGKKTFLAVCHHEDGSVEYVEDESRISIIPFQKRKKLTGILSLL